MTTWNRGGASVAKLKLRGLPSCPPPPLHLLAGCLYLRPYALTRWLPPLAGWPPLPSFLGG